MALVNGSRLDRPRLEAAVSGCPILGSVTIHDSSVSILNVEVSVHFLGKKTGWEGKSLSGTCMAEVCLVHAWVKAGYRCWCAQAGKQDIWSMLSAPECLFYFN